MKTNKKALRVDLGKYKKPNPYKGDIIKDQKGQWKYPGLKTRIEGSDTGTDITMAGVPFPVVGTDNTGFSQMMYPNQDYRFPGKYVDETPMAKVGGVPELPLTKGRHAYKAWGYTMNDIIAENKKKKGGEKKYSRDMAATNKILKESALFKKKKSKKKKIFDPTSKYFQDGGLTKTNLTSEEEAQFQKFYNTLPENLRQDEPDYDIRGYWDSEGRPTEFNYNQPKESNGYYNAYSINSNTGEYLKAPSHETFQHAVDEDRKIGWRPITNVQGRNIAIENQSIALPEEQSFLVNRTGPTNYIEADLTPEEIEEYRKGGYVVEDISVPTLTKAQFGTAQSGPKPGGLIPAKTAAQVQKEELAKGKGPTAQAAQKINQAAAARAQYEKQEAARRRAEEAKRLKQEVSPASSTAVATDIREIENMPELLAAKKADDAYRQQALDRGYIAEAYGRDLYNQIPTTQEYFEGYRSDPEGEYTQEDIARTENRDALEGNVEEAKYNIWRRNEEREYQNTPWYGKALNEAQSFMADPYLHTERALQGKRSLLGQGQVIVAPEDAENAEYYDRTFGDRGLSNTMASELLKVFNPMYYGAAAGMDARKGDYGSAALNVGQGLLSGSYLSKSDKLKKMFDTQMFLETLQEAPETLSAWGDPESNPYVNAVNTALTLGYGRAGLKSLKPGAQQIGKELKAVGAYKKGGLTNYQSGGKIYEYAGRPGAVYTKDKSGNWMIKTKGTNNEFVPIQDPKGERTKILNAQAKVVSPAQSKDFEDWKKNMSENIKARQRWEAKSAGVAQPSDWMWTLPIAGTSAGRAGISALTAAGNAILDAPLVSSAPNVTLGNIGRVYTVAASAQAAPQVYRDIKSAKTTDERINAGINALSTGIGLSPLVKWSNPIYNYVGTPLTFGQNVQKLANKADEYNPVTGLANTFRTLKLIAGRKDGGAHETELTPKQIQWYRSQGYIVEELD